VLVVSCLNPHEPTLGVPEFGNAPEIRWAEDVREQEEQIVTTLMRDALLSQFHAALARTIRAEPSAILLNWLPDPVTLLRIEAERRKRGEIGPATIYYPGQLSALDLDMLWELLPHFSLKSFEESWS
jgi:hypothetical protein